MVLLIGAVGGLYLIRRLGLVLGELRDSEEVGWEGVLSAERGRGPTELAAGQTLIL